MGLKYSHPTRKCSCRNLWVTDSCKCHYYWPLSDIKLRFTKMKCLCACLGGISGGVEVQHQFSEPGHSANCMCGRRSLWDTFSRRLFVAQSQFWCQLNEDMYLKIILHYVVLLQDNLYTCEVQSTGNLGGGGGGDSVVNFSYWQLTWPSDWSPCKFVFGTCSHVDW
jgi:hypothetical protein